MRYSINEATLVGKLGRDPELRYASSGTAICSFSMATDYRYKKDGEWNSKTTWHNIVIFGKDAENLGQSLAKGDTVFVRGRIEEETWETNDGERRRATKIYANEIYALAKQQRSQDREDRHEQSGSSFAPDAPPEDEIAF